MDAIHRQSPHASERGNGSEMGEYSGTSPARTWKQQTFRRRSAQSLRGRKFHAKPLLLHPVYATSQRGFPVTSLGHESRLFTLTPLQSTREARGPA